jgi:hypothetical protein
VRSLSGTSVPDAVSGFRAVSRDAAFRLNIISPFSYTIEMLIQAGKKHMAVTSVPVRVNPKTRESRLFRSIPRFLERSLTTMVRMYAMYQPLRVFFYVGVVLSTIGVLPILRFLVLFAMGEGQGHIQSLVIGGALLVIGLVTFLVGLVADLINFNRQLIELGLERIRRMELGDPPQAAPTLGDGHDRELARQPASDWATVGHAGGARTAEQRGTADERARANG